MDKFLVQVTIFFNDQTKKVVVIDLLSAIRLHEEEPNDPTIFDLDIQVWRDDEEPA